MPTEQVNIRLGRQVFKVPLNIYDVSLGGYRQVTLYVRSPKTAEDGWVAQVLNAQRIVECVAGSSEWYQSCSYILKHYGEEAEKDFVTGPREWTGTVLDFDHEELLEGIRLREDMPLDEVRANPYGAIESIRTRLGREQDIYLPHESKLVKDLPPKYTPLIRQLWGVSDLEELPDYTFLAVNPSGFQPVVRRDWGWSPRVDWRVDAGAGYGTVGRGFAARLVSEERPQDVLTREEYENLVKALSEKPELVE